MNAKRRTWLEIARSRGAGWALVASCLLAGCAPREAVVLYTSQDQFYAEEILKEFTAATGVKVAAVFDSESAKTAGLANRLRAERTNPRCDLFWNNEEMHTRFLAREGVLESWEAAGYRSRRVVINTNYLSPRDAPNSLLEWTDPKWKRKIALAYPLFGTTSLHFLALRQHWGEARWRAWCEGLVKNSALIVDGNSIVVKVVGSGEAWIGLTDSDDIAAGKRNGLPILELPLGSESLFIPNTIGLCAKPRRHPHAITLAKHIARPETLRKLVALGALEGADPPPPQGGGLRIDWERAFEDFPQITEFLKQVFVRS